MKPQSNVHANAAWICRASPADPMWLLPAASRRESRWRNGGGRTFEVACDPPGSTPDGFNWRISIAEIAAPGPFSSFAGVDRTLTLVRGGSLTLWFGEDERLLTSPFDQVCFAGEQFVKTALDSPALVVNVMTRRGLHQHHARQVKDGERLQAAAGEILVLVALRETVRVGEAMLSRFDAALLSPADPVLVHDADERSGLLVSISSRIDARIGRTVHPQACSCSRISDR